MPPSVGGEDCGNTMVYGQLKPTVKGLSHQSSGTMGSVSDLKTFQARTGRKTHSGKDGKYNGGISTTRGAQGPYPVFS